MWCASFLALAAKACSIARMFATNICWFPRENTILQQTSEFRVIGLCLSNYSHPCVIERRWPASLLLSDLLCSILKGLLSNSTYNLRDRYDERLTYRTYDRTVLGLSSSMNGARLQQSILIRARFAFSLEVVCEAGARNRRPVE